MLLPLDAIKKGASLRFLKEGKKKCSQSNDPGSINNYQIKIQNGVEELKWNS